MPKSTANSRTFRKQRRDLYKIRQEVAKTIRSDKLCKKNMAMVEKAKRIATRAVAAMVDRLAEVEKKLKTTEEEKEIFRKSMINFNSSCRDLQKENMKMKAYIKQVYGEIACLRGWAGL
jgi:chromosome segregation ATPase